VARAIVMAEERVNRRLAAILAADVVGYSQLMGLDEEGTLAVLKEHRRNIVEPMVSDHHGRIVKTMGDGFLVEFASAVDAVRCAMEIQRILAQHNRSALKKRRIEMRIGINVGDIIVDDDDDVYGDGVNIAARIEPLAEPNTICLSENAYRQIKGKLAFDVTDMGERRLENIAQPIRVFRIKGGAGTAVKSPHIRFGGRNWQRLSGIALAAAVLLTTGVVFWWQPWVHRDAPASMTRMAYPLPEKPSIAVLPFTNMSADPQQEYFADGIAEDIITDLSKVPKLFVIARNSTFTYKGRSVKIRQVAEDLGIRYVVEGSVQRAGERVRINAQLIDATTGGHLWAERYDGSMADIFGLQDKVTNKIVTALALNLGAKLPGSPEKTSSSKAYDTFLQGWELYHRFSADGFSKAIPYFESAIKLDQNYGRPYAALASIYWESWRQGESWTSKVNPDVSNQGSYEGARYKAQKYLQLAMQNPTPLAHRVASAMDWNFRKFDEAIAEAETAVALDPSDPNGHIALAWALIFSGRPQDALPAVDRAMRLDPLHPDIYAYILGMSRLGMEQFEEAATILERARMRSDQERDLNVPLTVAYERLGRHNDARIALRRYSAVWSMFSSAYVDDVMGWWPFKREGDIRRFGTSLISAGLCCADRLERYIENVRQGGTLE
jgi:adenylate cyclase